MLTLSTLAGQYLEENFWLAESTRQTTERAFRRLTAVCSNLTLDRLKFEHGERFRNEMLKGGLSKNSVNIYLRSVQPVLNWAVQRGLLDANPLKGVRQIKVTKSPVRTYNDFEFKQILNAAKTSQWRLMLMLARFCGLRRGEVLNLTKNNVRNSLVFIEPKRNTAETWEWEPKDKELRRVPVPAEFERAIKDMPCFYVALTPKRYEYLLTLLKSGVLSSGQRKCPIENFNRAFKAIQLRAFGRRTGTFQDLRRTYATEMVRVLPGKFVAQLMGHSTEVTTATYYYGFDDSHFNIARNAIEKGIAIGLHSTKGALIATPSELGGIGLEPMTPCV